MHFSITFAAEGDLRLVNNGQVTTLSGLLQIYHNKQFYYICDDDFDTEDAEVTSSSSSFSYSSSSLTFAPW